MMPRAAHAEELEAMARTGLTSVAADEIPSRHGANRPPAAHRPLLTRVLGQFRDPMIMMLCAAWEVVLVARRQGSGPEPPPSASPTEAPSKEEEMAT